MRAADSLSKQSRKIVADQYRAWRKLGPVGKAVALASRDASKSYGNLVIYGTTHPELLP